MIRNNKHINSLNYFIAIILLLLSFACRSKKNNEPVLFETLDYHKTGLDFYNRVTPTDSFNMFDYMYFYNGSGIGAGDFNNDGLIDLFFAANQGNNKLYLNEGNLHFNDATQQAAIPQNHGWSTGVSVVDINNDGLLDIYICEVGNFETLHGKNQLLVCKGIKDGIPFYEDEAAKYGIDFSGFSTQAVFLDYDMDGDLDMFLLNHSIHQNGNFAPRANFLGTYSPLSGDKMYRNDGSRFTDVTRQSAINSSAISYGLGVAVADINLDGWPDIYAGNDFHENDYLYINQKNGTFADESDKHLMHTSHFSMGVDIADVNNDAFPEIVSMDMLPANPYILKRSLGEDDYDIFYNKIAIGYNYQYTRNNLQFNRRNGMFSEIGIYSGIYATDWSWSSLWIDFDNDSKKDLFISNGIPKRLNDIDYINFVYTPEIQQKINNSTFKSKDIELIKKFPEIKIPNKFYSNNGEMKFLDMKDQIRNDQPTFSNGAVYADLDNDGDLDIVVNNINDPALVYENKTKGQNSNHYVDLKLEGPDKNINALGAKVFLFTKQGIRSYENYPVHGFQSSMQIPLHIGLDSVHIDSAFLVWPDNTCQPLLFDKTDTIKTITYKENLPSFLYTTVTGYFQHKSVAFEDITNQTNLIYKHEENPFREFTREPLIPHMLSTEGPALALADINKDGTEDIFIGSSKTTKPAVFVQQANGTYIKTIQPDLEKDSLNEETAACWADINNDGLPDLITANGGNEYYGTDIHLTPCVYLNNGEGRLSKLPDAFNSIFINASSICSYDFNNDGYIDLFIGGRSVPWEYGKIPRSYLLQNDGKGHFIDVTNKIAPGLLQPGMITDAQWFDIDKDGDKDLLLVFEWGGVTAYINNKGIFSAKSITNNNGWWNFLLPVDIDNDGDIDFIAGNQGLNSRLKPSISQPVRLYYNDFDDNGKKEQILTYYIEGKEIPFASKDELERQMPGLKKKYLYAEDFAKANLREIFSDDKIEQSALLQVNYFSSAVFINDGNLNFTVKDLPWQAQLSPLRTAAIIDANHDTLPDILVMGNYYDNSIQLGRNDGDFGTVLINKGQGEFEAETMNGFVVRGQVRHLQATKRKNQTAFIIAMNNDSLRVIGYK